MKSVKPYKVDGITCEVVENPTGLAIARGNNTRDAKQIANFLNGGNGFNGYTPQFFLSRLVA